MAPTPLPNLSVRQLRAFALLADTASFTRAAEACHLSQPAFSALVRSLEEALGARLFDRDTRSVRLTAEGRLFEPAARQLLDDFGTAVGSLADHVGRRKGRVHMAALPSLAAGWLPPVFAEFRARWPGIAMELSDELSDGCLDLVRSGRADFALASSPGSGQGELHAVELCADGFHLVCPRDHPLATLPRLTLRTLAPYPFVHLTRNSSVRQALEAALHPVQLHTVLEVGQLSTVAGMVEAGMGISLLPALTLFHFRKDTLAVRPVASKRLLRRIYLVRRRGESLSVAAQALYDLVAGRMRTGAPGSARPPA